MVFPIYEAFGLLEPDSNFSMDVAAAHLAARFPRWALHHEGSKISLVSGKWAFYLCLNSEPWVIQESREIAQALPEDLAVAVAITRCGRRIEVSSDPDPNMDYFNDYIFVVEVLQSFEGVITVDPREPCII